MSEENKAAKVPAPKPDLSIGEKVPDGSPQKLERIKIEHPDLPDAGVVVVTRGAFDTKGGFKAKGWTVKGDDS